MAEVAEAGQALVDSAVTGADCPASAATEALAGILRNQALSVKAPESVPVSAGLFPGRRLGIHEDPDSELA